MSKINDGGPAFPRIGEGFGNDLYDAPGMSLRDYFAAKAMQAFLHPGADEDIDIPAAAYRWADAMLKEREK